MTVKFIDLFAGLGGMRLGLEQACTIFELPYECVFTSEVKPHAIATYQDNFNNSNIQGDITELETMLEDLVNKGYLRFEHPKDIVEVKNSSGKPIKKRAYRTDLSKGYNIVVGKLSFPLNEILDPQKITPTLLATDMAKLAVIDGQGLRQLTIREGLRLLGFPENYQITLSQDKAYDLLGNTVVVPVIKEITLRLLASNILHNKSKTHNPEFVSR